MSHQVGTPPNDALNVDRGLESLQSSAEFRGPVEPVDDAHRHHCNDHIALIHESRAEQFAAVVPFVRQGLAADERCLYVVEDTSKGAIVSALREGGVDVDDVLAFESRLPVSSLERVARRDGHHGTVHLFEARHAYQGLPRDLLEHGGRLHGLHADDATVTVTVDIHTGTDAREFVEMFRTKYDGAELVAKRDRERSLETVGEFRAELTEDLTPRQREVLETAYYSGYFEEPRTRTGGEIAASMDISQPTFTTHFRAAERKIYGELFDDA